MPLTWNRRTWLRLVAVVLLVAGAAVSLIPSRCLAPSLVPFTEVKGRFDGSPVIFAPPALTGRSFPVYFELELDHGACEVSRLDAQGNRHRMMSLHKGKATSAPLAADEKLVLDPGANVGSYYVFLGSSTPGCDP